MNSSVNYRRARRPALLDPILDIVSALRKVSTKSDQAHVVDSFLENGFIDYEPLVVRRKDGHYVVVEGNRRLASIRHIRQNRDRYLNRSSRLDDLESIPVLIFPEQPDAQDVKEQRVYLGVRHLFGFREWPSDAKLGI